MDKKSAMIAHQSALRVEAPAFVPSFGSDSAFDSPSSVVNSPVFLAVSSASSVCSGDSADHNDIVEDEDSSEDGHSLTQNYLYHRYVAVLEKALAERTALGPGNSPLLRSLYPFWLARLTHKFNRNMYRTFVRLAVEDCAVGDHFGLRMTHSDLSHVLRNGLALSLLLRQPALYFPRAPLPGLCPLCSRRGRRQYARC
jgi:hypothetical protein